MWPWMKTSNKRGGKDDRWRAGVMILKTEKSRRNGPPREEHRCNGPGQKEEV